MREWGKGGVKTTFQRMRELLCWTWLIKLIGVSALLPAEKKNWRPRQSLNEWINQGSNDTADCDAPAHSHTHQPAYRFAGFASLQKVLRWGACQLGSSLSASAHSHSLLWKAQWGATLTFNFFCEKEMTQRKKMHISTHISLYLGSPDLFFKFFLTYFIVIYLYTSNVP